MARLIQGRGGMDVLARDARVVPVVAMEGMWPTSYGDLLWCSVRAARARATVAAGGIGGSPVVWMRSFACGDGGCSGRAVQEAGELLTAVGQEAGSSR